MNVKSVQGYKSNLTQDSLFRHKSPLDYPEKNIAGLCGKENNRGYNIAFSGSIQSKSVAAANSLTNKLFQSDTFGKFLKYTHEHNIATSALIALGLAGVLRPATILALPGKKDKDDKTYAAGHAFASGVVGFIASLILTSPLDTALNKLYDNKKDFFGSKTLQKIQQEINEKEVLKKAGTLDEAGQKALKALYNKKGAIKTLVKNIPDWIIAVPRATITIALIPPILKYVFGMEKKKKPQVQDPKLQINNQPNKDEKITSVNLTTNSVFQNIMKGGNQ